MALPRAALALLLFAGAAAAADPVPVAPAAADPPGTDASCVHCHAGLEEMHPWAPLGCVQCHGGDGRMTDKDGAHVRPRDGWPADERVLDPGFDPDAVRFRNPATCASPTRPAASATAAKPSTCAEACTPRPPATSRTASTRTAC